MPDLDEPVADIFGRTIQVFLVEGVPLGLRVASIYGWTGSIVVSQQASFSKLLSRPEVDRTGLYILYGAETEREQYELRAYVGEADIVRKRIKESADQRAFWETALVITTSDDALTKGHVRYLEARIIELAKAADRINLDNTQEPSAENKRLPEADRANMEGFISNLAVILPVIGLDIFKPKGRMIAGIKTVRDRTVRFEIRGRSGVQAFAVEKDGDFIVLAGSTAVKDSEFVGRGYAPLKERLIKAEVLVETEQGNFYRFVVDHTFPSVSAAAAVVLDRNANGRTEWKVENTQETYAAWQERQEAVAS